MKKTVALGVVCCFLATNVFAGPAFPVQIPSRLGSVVHQTRIDASRPLIIQIQNIHAHYEAQIQIKGILEYLVANYGLRFVGLEGGEGPLEPGRFRLAADPAANEKIIDPWVRRGELTGAEFFAIQNQTPGVQLMGLEQAGPYTEDLKLLKAALKRRENILSRVGSLHEDEPLDFSGLKQKAAEQLGLDFLDSKNQKEFPALVRIAHLEKLHASGEPSDERVARDKRHIIELLAGQIPSGDARGSYLLGALKQLEPGKWNLDLEPRYFFEHLYAYVPIDRFPAFTLRAKRWILESEIQAPELAREIAALEDRIDPQAKDFKVFKRMLLFEATRDDTRYFRSHKKHFQAAWPEFASELATAEQFYRLAVRREQVMVSRLVREVKRRHLQCAAIVTGGFHTEGIARLLGKRGMDSVTLEPQVSWASASSSDLYHHLILDPKTSTLELPLKLVSAANYAAFNPGDSHRPERILRRASSTAFSLGGDYYGREGNRQDNGAIERMLRTKEEWKEWDFVRGRSYDEYCAFHSKLYNRRLDERKADVESSPFSLSPWTDYAKIVDEKLAREREKSLIERIRREKEEEAFKNVGCLQAIAIMVPSLTLAIVYLRAVFAYGLSPLFVIGFPVVIGFIVLSFKFAQDQDFNRTMKHNHESSKKEVARQEAERERRRSEASSLGQLSAERDSRGTRLVLDRVTEGLAGPGDEALLADSATGPTPTFEPHFSIAAATASSVHFLARLRRRLSLAA